jgi:dolichol-phosphate mannosyltransferase
MKHSKFIKNYLYDFVVVVTVKKEKNIKKFVKQIKQNLINKNYCLIFYFDKSRDINTFKTFLTLSKKYKNMFVIYNHKVKNLADAYYNAYLYASKIKSEWVISMNAGFRHQPSDLKYFINKLNHNVSCIWGYRSLVAKNYSIKRRIISKLGNFLSINFLNLSIKDPTSGFYAIKSNLLKNVLIKIKKFKSKYHFFDTELKFYLRKEKYLSQKIKYKTPNKSLPFKILLDSFITLIRLIFDKKLN